MSAYVLWGFSLFLGSSLFSLPLRNQLEARSGWYYAERKIPFHIESCHHLKEIQMPPCFREKFCRCSCFIFVFTRYPCSYAKLLTIGHKASNGRPRSFVEILWFCSLYHVWSRSQCVHTSSLPRVAPMLFRYCDHAGGLVDQGPGCFGEKTGQWLGLFAAERDYRSWRPWLITQRQTSEYSWGKGSTF